MLTNVQAKVVIASAERACANLNAKGGRYNASDIADIAQETFLKVAATWDASRGDLAGYAYIVARNLTLDGLRTRARRGEASLDATSGDDSPTTLHSIIPDHAPNPRDALIMKRRVDAARAAVANLSKSAQSALDIACDDESMSGAERQAKRRAIEALQEVLVA
jgi:DNA-directed RNA polymerase specialized sigma24 family protein